MVKIGADTPVGAGMPREKTSPDLAAGQIGSPKRGTYSLRVIEYRAGLSSVRVQKFSPAGIYESPVLGPYEVTISVSSVRKDYKLKEQP
mgnify:FL=1